MSAVMLQHGVHENNSDTPQPDTIKNSYVDILYFEIIQKIQIGG